jgi:hypothetical protein
MKRMTPLESHYKFPPTQNPHQLEQSGNKTHCETTNFPDLLEVTLNLIPRSLNTADYSFCQLVNPMHDRIQEIHEAA